MKTRKTFWRKGLHAVAGESGATFIEYAMLVGLIAIVVAIAVAALGNHLKGIFSQTKEQASKVEADVQGATIKGDFGDVN